MKSGNQVLRNEEEFQWAQRHFVTYNGLYWLHVLSFLIIEFAILLYLFHRKIMYAALTELTKISQVNKTEAAYICTMPEHNIFNTAALPSLTEEEETAITTLFFPH